MTTTVPITTPTDSILNGISKDLKQNNVWDWINPLNALEKWNKFKSNLGLPNPGTFEQLHHETKNIFTTNHQIDGAQFEFIRTLTPNLQINNTFTLGSSQAPPAYNFIGLYGTENVFFQGSVDNDLNCTGRLFYTLGHGLTAKCTVQSGLRAAQHMVQLESDYTGPDNSLNIKAINPSLSDSTGIIIANYFQSITSKLSLGTEAMFQRSSREMEDSMLSFVAKYATPESILTAQLHDQGVMQTSYFHKISDMVETAVDLQVIAAQGKRDAICTVGAKFEFKAATMRTSIDTTGKINTVLEERIVPPLALILSAELDHMKGASKFGFGVRFST